MAPSYLNRQIDAWVEVVHDVLGRSWLPGWHREVLPRLSETFGCAVSLNWAEPDGLHKPEFFGVPDGWPTADEALACQSILEYHPLLKWYAISGDPAPMTISRVPSVVASPRDRELVNDVLSPPGLQHQLSVVMVDSDSRDLAFVLGRTDDFGDDEVQLARLIQPLLLLLYRQGNVMPQTHQLSDFARSELTPREIGVISLLARGLTARAIGRTLGISERTVHKHLQNSYRKLCACDRVSALTAASAAGVLQPSTAPPEESASVEQTAGA